MNLLIAIKKNQVLLIILAIAASYFFFYNYFVNGSSPIGNFQGHYLWYDQSRYLLMAKELSKFKLINYDYGLGYPILAIPFLSLFPKDPFLMPNFIIWILSLGFYFKICQIVFNDKVFPVICCLFYIFTTNIIQYMVIPWNSTVVLLANLIILYLSVMNKRSNIRSILICLMLVWIFSARYIDIVFSSLLSILYFWQYLVKKNYIHLLTIFIILIFGVFLILSTHRLKFGSFLRTPYAHHLDPQGKISDQDIKKYNLKYVPKDLTGILIGSKEYSYFPSLLNTSFYMILIPFGMIVGLNKKDRKFTLISGLSMIFAFIFYASFPHFSIDGLKVGAIHYVKAWFPIMVIYFVFFVRFLTNLSGYVKKK